MSANQQMTRGKFTMNCDRNDRIDPMTATIGTIDPARRVLVIFPGALGDFVCALPAIEAIAGRHRSASIELMARAELARLAVGRTVVARGYSIDAPHVSRLFSESSAADLDAREFFGSYERIYSFFASNDAQFRNALAAATDGEVTFHPFRPIDNFPSEPHIAAAYLRSIDAADAPMRPRIEPSSDDLRAASEAIASLGRDASNLIAIFPGSGSPVKNWPLDKFATLARTLSESASVVFILGPAESAIEQRLHEYNLPILKDLDLGTVAGIARLASGFVGNDSGVSHFAAASDAPGVVIFGPTDPARWRPLGRIVVLGAREIDTIEVGEVAAAFAQICGGRDSAAPKDYRVEKRVP
jgi:lipopolysaccharide heptosyltransferase III